MAEADLWATLQRHTKTLGDFQRIENMVGRGWPDVNYCVNGIEGHIELKWAARWPATPIPLKLDHYTPQQRLWAKRRLSAGGRVYLLLQVGKEYLLFNSRWSAECLGKTATQGDCYANALVVQDGQFPTARVAAALQMNDPFTIPA